MDTAARMIDVALEAGVTVVDTANGYAGGATETSSPGAPRSAPDCGPMPAYHR